MEIMNVFRGLKKSQSGPNLTFSERISLARKSKRDKDRNGLVTSPLPPRPPSRGATAPVASGSSPANGSNKGGRAVIDNIPENRIYETKKLSQAEDPHDLKLPVPDEIYASLESLAVTKNLPKSEPADELSPPINEKFFGEISDNENAKKPFRERTNIGENHVRKSRSKSVVSYSRAKPKKVTIKDDDLYAGKENGGNGSGPASGVCPGCRVPFNTGKQRRLLDSCGHERCYTCMFQTDQCPICTGELPQPLHSSSVSNMAFRCLSPGPAVGMTRSAVGSSGVNPDCVYGSVNGLGSARSIIGPGSGIGTRSVSVTPPNYRKNINPSPAYNRRNWIQRHTRRPVTMDDHTMSALLRSRSGDMVVPRHVRNTLKEIWEIDDASSTTSSKPPVSAYGGGGGKLGHHHPAGSYTQLQHMGPPRRRDSSSGRAYSAGQESGFQSRSSLLSLNPSLTSGPISTLTDSNKDFNVEYLTGIDTTDTESLASFSSNLSLQPPPSLHHHPASLINGRMSPHPGGPLYGGGRMSPHPGGPPSAIGSRRNSLSRLQAGSSAESVARFHHQMRRSARLPARNARADSAGPFLQYRPVQWFLKPLYFEVPQRQNEKHVFIGREWIYREISSQLTSSLPTNRGVLISGNPGTGKTAIILNLVERSSFGTGGADVRQDNIYSQQEPVYSRITNSSSQQSLSQQPQPPTAVPCGSSSIYGAATPSGQMSTASSQQQSLYSQVVAYHFCQVDNFVTCQVAEWIHSLAAQLSQAPQLESYHSLLSTDHELRGRLALSKCLSDPDSALTEGILTPLVSLQKSGKLPFTAQSNAIILIDALCDAEFHRPDYGYTLSQFLARHLPAFPSWLKIVCTVRTSSKQTCAANLPFHNISLDNHDVDERLQKDIGDYITHRINSSPQIQTNIVPSSLQLPSSRLFATDTDQSTPPAAKFQSHVLTAAKGSFLFAKLLLDVVEKGSIVIKSSFKVLPQTLAQIFMLEFNLRFPTSQSFQIVSSILSVCLASLQPLTLSQIYLAVLATWLSDQQPQPAAAGSSSQESKAITWEQFLSTYNTHLSDFLVKRRDDSICFFHPLFREWLVRRADKDSLKFLCDPRHGHIALSLSMCRAEKSLGPEKSLELAHHILKSNIYKNQTSEIPTRDLLASWISLVTDDISLALGSERNMFSPSINLTKLILLSGANPNQTTMHLNNAPLLCVFAERGYTELVSLLLEYGADPNSGNADGFTAVTFACISGHLECLRVLVEAGALITKVDNTESCALVHAARHGHLSLLEYLISLDWEQCTCPPGRSCSMPTCKKRVSLPELAQQAAVAASAAGKLDILEFLLDMREVDVNRSDTLLGETLLGAAAANGRRDCCQALIKRKARLTSTNLREATPLHQAAREGHWSVCELLLSEGAPVESKDALGRTPLISAAMEGHLGIVEHLVSVRKSNIDVLDKENMSPLTWACSRGKLETVKFLISNKADLTGVDKKGRTALDHAATNGDPELVAYLLDNGAMMEHVDMNGMRALDRSIACGNIDVVKVFLKKGAKLGPTTWNMANRKPEIMLCLLNKLLEDGNTLYRRNRLEDAAVRYQYAIKRIPASVIGKFQKVFDQLRIHLLLNLSRCRRKMKKYSEAIEHASEVIKLYPHVYEAFQTRARSHQAAGDLQMAYADFSQAVRLAPQNRELHRDLLAVKEELQSPSKPLPDSMFVATGPGSPQKPQSPVKTTQSPVHNPLTIKEHRRLAVDELKDADSSGSTSSGVGSSL